MTETLSRRQLFNRFSGRADAIRPPFALSENKFVEACTGCERCLTVCRQGILVGGRGRYPVVDFQRGGCTFCGDCAAACPEPAFLADRSGRPWTLTAQVSDGCLERQGISCRLCENRCEANAMRFRPMIGGRSELKIDRARCTGCGACVASCPAKALTVGETIKEGALS